MKVRSASNSLNFGKTAVMKCRVTNTDDKTKTSATLYKLDPRDSDDIKDVMYSKNTLAIRSDFYRQYNRPYGGREFYMMMNDKNNEVISCAQTVRKYVKSGDKTDGISTVIEELSENSKYKGGDLSIISYLVHQAQRLFDKKVTAAFHSDNPKQLRVLSFSKVKGGAYTLPERRYNTFLDKCRNKFEVSFLV